MSGLRGAVLGICLCMSALTAVSVGPVAAQTPAAPAVDPAARSQRSKDTVLKPSSPAPSQPPG